MNDACTGGSDLSDVSDGALRKAIQATQNAEGSIEYAIKMLGGFPAEENTAADEASMARWHIMDLSNRLAKEWNHRQSDSQ